MKFRRGMTLAEVLLVFTIIGVVSVFTVCSVRPWEKSYKYAYSRIYNALNLAIYNAMVKNFKFPENINLFCQDVFYYINTSEANMKNVGDIESKCSSISNVGLGPEISSQQASKDWFTSDKSVRLSNGMRIWFGAAHSGAPFSIVEGGGTVNYYMVYVDLNGDSKPNTAVYSPTRIADIVAMAVTDRYTVIPLGYPEIDIRYMQAHVISPAQDEDEEDYESDPLPYFYAKRLAFGWETSGDNQAIVNAVEPLTLDFNSKMNENGPFRLNYDTVDDRLKPENMEPICKINSEALARGYNNPPCKIKIYEYH